MAGAGSEPLSQATRLVVLTGADGFIGRALRLHWAHTGRPFRATARRGSSTARGSAGMLAIDDLAVASDRELHALVAGASAIVHLAGRAHVMHDTSADPRAAYRAANVETTVRLAQAALGAGVARFVLASSIKVYGEKSDTGRPFGPADPPAPADAYAISKLEAERELAAIAAGSPLAPIVLRLPLVYGPGVGANFLALLDAVARHRWLPLAAVRARRSLLYVGNLASAIDAALNAVPAPVGVHCIADPESVTLPDLVRGLAAALGVHARLLPVPVPLLRLAGALVGRAAAVRRLTVSLEVDSTGFRQATGWTPPATLAQGLAETARWWVCRHAL